MTARTLTRLSSAAALAVSLVLAAAPTYSATIQIVNIDGAGTGFNDPTAVAPIGGNPGTTLGAQRLNVFNQAAAIWGAILPSTVTIKVDATMTSLTPCTATSGVLGSTGTNTIWANFSGAEFPNTYYPVALANKQHGADLDPTASDMLARFNVDVDNATCLGTSNWYYGYDHNEGTNVDMLAVVTHELGHGLGFASFVTLTTGAQAGGLGDIFTRFLYDDTQQLFWNQMTDAQRVASAVNDQHLVWRGGRTINQAPHFLGPQQFVRFDGDAAVAAGVGGNRAFGTAAFGPPLGSPAITGTVVYVQDAVAPAGDGCEHPWTNQALLPGNIALIDRGTCAFTAKTEYAQSVGAVAVIIANNAAGVIPLGGTSATTIPTVCISLADGNLLKTALASGPVTATLGTRPPFLQGADDSDAPLMYAPNPLQPGSSVSHFDVSASPDLLMEPAINPGLTSSVDLTRYVFEDEGWFPRVLGVTLPSGEPLRLDAGSPNPFRLQTSIRYSIPRAGLTQMGIFDIGGRMVKRVMKAAWQPAGSGTVVWDATNDSGARVAPGVYLYRMQSGGQTVTQRVVVAD